VTAGYSTGSVTSADGTRVSYRQVGRGPGVVLVHGGGQAAQNLMHLAWALSNEFTVYLPDRRGRGSSGPPGDRYGLSVESQDLDALLRQTGSEFVFGLSSGALVCLHAALSLPQIRKIALYEPPLSIGHSTPIDWLGRFDREVADGKLGSAMITAVRGTRTAPALIRWTPRFLLAPLLDVAARRSAVHPGRGGPTAGASMSPGRRAVLLVLLWPVRRLAAGRTARGPGDVDAADVPLSALVPTMHFDAQLVVESEGQLSDYHSVAAPVLLLGGSDSPTYLKRTLGRLETTLPQVRRVELPGVGHLAPDNTGQPERVASEVRRFFDMGHRSSS
jgi:pimeloyl-ACP methyl ester carboxylesterase